MNTRTNLINNYKKETNVPYKIVGTTVMHKKNGKWTKKQKTSSRSNAKKAKRLLDAIDHGYQPTHYYSA